MCIFQVLLSINHCKSFTKEIIIKLLEKYNIYEGTKYAHEVYFLEYIYACYTSVIFYSMSLFKFYNIHHENVTDLIHTDQWTVKNMTFERKSNMKEPIFSSYYIPSALWGKNSHLF